MNKIIAVLFFVLCLAFSILTGCNKAPLAPVEPSGTIQVLGSGQATLIYPAHVNNYLNGTIVALPFNGPVSDLIQGEESFSAYGAGVTYLSVTLSTGQSASASAPVSTNLYSVSF